MTPNCSSRTPSVCQYKHQSLVALDMICCAKGESTGFFFVLASEWNHLMAAAAPVTTLSDGVEAFNSQRYFAQTSSPMGNLIGYLCERSHRINWRHLYRYVFIVPSDLPRMASKIIWFLDPSSQLGKSLQKGWSRITCRKNVAKHYWIAWNWSIAACNNALKIWGTQQGISIPTMFKC